MTGAHHATAGPPGHAHVQRVSLLPGSDRLSGRCFCGAEGEADDPVQMWEWLLAHPDHPQGGASTPEEPVAPPPAHIVTDPGVLRRVPVSA